MVDLKDIKYVDPGTIRYRLYCDGCGADRKYGMKSRASMLCKKCAHKGKDRMLNKRDATYREKMSRAKKGQVPWCAGKTGIFSVETLKRMHYKRVSQLPRKHLMSADQYRIKRSCLNYLRSQIINYVKNNRYSNYCSNLFPFSFDKFIERFESKFKPGMSWSNHGRNGWHVDHITPDSAFAYSSIKDEDFFKSWSIDNLQPLWACENMSKGYTLPSLRV